MRIKINFAALKDAKWHEYALRFLFGGLVTIATGLIAKKFGPGVGGLFLAFPAIFPATATLIASHEKEKKRRACFDGTRRGRDAAAIEARGTAFGCLGLFAFGLVMRRLLPAHRALPVFVAAAAAWFAVSVLCWRVGIAARHAGS